MWGKALTKLAKEVEVQGNIFLRLEWQGRMAQPQMLLNALVKISECAEHIPKDAPALRSPCGRIVRRARICQQKLRELAGHNTHSEHGVLTRHFLELELPRIVDIARTTAPTADAHAA